MDEDEDEYLLMKNYETLKTHLKIDCSKFLGNVLQILYQDIENLEKSETFEKLDEESKQEIAKRKSFVLSIPALCDILLKKKCDFEDGTKLWLDDVSRLRDIWDIHVKRNDGETISSSSLQAIQRELKEIGDRMAERFGDIGHSYVASIQGLQQDGKQIYTDDTLQKRIMIKKPSFERFLKMLFVGTFPNQAKAK